MKTIIYRSEGFKREYTAYVSHEKKKEKAMKDPYSTKAKKLAMEKMKHEFWDILRKEVLF